jgi:hypothetical protein
MENFWSVRIMPIKPPADLRSGTLVPPYQTSN